MPRPPGLSLLVGVLLPAGSHCAFAFWVRSRPFRDRDLTQFALAPQPPRRSACAGATAPETFGVRVRRSRATRDALVALPTRLAADQLLDRARQAGYEIEHLRPVGGDHNARHLLVQRSHPLLERLPLVRRD